MPVINRISDFTDEIAEWRHDFHANPELLFDVGRTAGRVTELLESFGVDEIATGIAENGVVAIINGSRTDSGKTIGLRADMDALPILEETGKPYASKTKGKMHACGHDGHTAMLLGVARYLSETRNFNGRVALIFQPAEEGGGGGKVMVDEGIMDRFNIEQVFGLHNMPGLPVGQFAIRPGPLMAAADSIEITINGKGGHAARPHGCVDPIVAGAAVVQALQTLASRNVDPLHSVVVSITQFNAGSAFNIIPATAELKGTVRSLDEDVRGQAEKRISEIATQVAAAYGARAEVRYERFYPPTVNHEAQTAFAGKIAAKVAGAQNVDLDTPPVMGGEDFSFMLQARPGAFIFTGNGDSAGLHHPEYDFNDEVIPYGVSYFVELVQTAMPSS